MRYFKHEHGGSSWMWDGKNMWHASSYGSPEELRERFADYLVETDAAGNPLGKYRYFRDTASPAGEWRTNGTTWELRVGPDDDWGRSTCSAVEEFMFDPTAYECDARGNRLEGKTAESPTPAPMSDEDRFRWQFAGQAMQGELASYSTEGSCLAMGQAAKKAGISIHEHLANISVLCADSLIAALKKPRATENGGGR